jgi:hypothetical protein
VIGAPGAEAVSPEVAAWRCAPAGSEGANGDAAAESIGSTDREEDASGGTGNCGWSTGGSATIPSAASNSGKALTSVSGNFGAVSAAAGGGSESAGAACSAGACGRPAPVGSGTTPFARLFKAAVSWPRKSAIEPSVATGAAANKLALLADGCGPGVLGTSGAMSGMCPPLAIDR